MNEDLMLFNNIRNINIKKKNNIVNLNNFSFSRGTFRITKPGLYRLIENIVFDPNPEYDYLPSPEQIKKNIYPVLRGPFVLGFFAAITVECDDVTIDLNNFSIVQSHKFYLKQRFFNTIEISRSPFITGQGPGNFGSNNNLIRKCFIKNGKLGLTSHNAIHGNNCENVSIENLVITDFEVGGISLNGVKNCFMKNLVITNSIGTRLKIPVNGRFSSAIFLLRQFNSIDEKDQNFFILSNNKKINLKNLKLKLTHLVDKAIDSSLQTGLSSVPVFNKEVLELFGNPSGMPDGSALYGILFNQLGVAINEFGSCNPGSGDKNSNRVFLENISISNLSLKPREVVGLYTKSGKIMKDFSGNLVLISKPIWYEGVNCYDPYKTFLDRNNYYDILLASQVILYKYGQENPRFRGVANIDDSVIEYINGGKYAYIKYNPKIKTFRNTDIMAHVMKGVVGIRIDCSDNVEIKSVNIQNLNNYGIKGLMSSEIGEYEDGKVGENIRHLGHPKSNSKYKGYTGNFCRGFTFNHSDKVKLNDTKIINLYSLNGKSIGIDIQEYNKVINLDNIFINTLQSLLPSVGVMIDKQNKDVEQKNVKCIGCDKEEDTK